MPTDPSLPFRTQMRSTALSDQLCAEIDSYFVKAHPTRIAKIASEMSRLRRESGDVLEKEIEAGRLTTESLTIFLATTLGLERIVREIARLSEHRNTHGEYPHE